MAREPIFHTANGINLACTWLNPTTKQAKRIIRMYENTTKGDSIFKAYGRPSQKKIFAFNEIVKEMSDVKGWGMRITGAGSDIFSCAYKCKDGSDYTYLVYHTPSNRFVILLED